jgi:DNA-directed RNA polymerase specialized sigma24 family protein
MSNSRDVLSRLPEDRLMGLVADLGAAAFEVLYDRHAGAVYGLCQRIVRSAALADDVCQEAFLRMRSPAGELASADTGRRKRATRPK